MRRLQRQQWLTLLIVVGVLALTLVTWTQPGMRRLIESPDELRRFIMSFGVLAPALTIGYHVLQVIFAPVPGQAIDIANGYLFGPLLGSVYSVLGIGIGSAIALFLSRRYGRPLVEFFVSAKGMKAVDRYVGERGEWFYFLLFLLPGTPDDILCFAVGLTKIPLGRALLLILFGRLPGIVAAVLIGSTGSRLALWQFLIVGVLVTAVAGVMMRGAGQRAER